MNSIFVKKSKTIHEKKFDQLLENTKQQVAQINKGIEMKKFLGEKNYCHHSGNKNFYLDELTKYYNGKGYTVKLLETEDIYSYKILIEW